MTGPELRDPQTGTEDRIEDPLETWDNVPEGQHFPHGKMIIFRNRDDTLELRIRIGNKWYKINDLSEV